MNRLIKPQKQSYTGEDAQVLAYSRLCEMAAILCSGVTLGLLGFGVAPAVVVAGVSCAVLAVICGLI